MFVRLQLPVFFFFKDTATTEIYTLSLHDALPILIPWPRLDRESTQSAGPRWLAGLRAAFDGRDRRRRSEEHTSELQSLTNLVCRLLLEKKKQKKIIDRGNHFFSTITPIHESQSLL